MGVPITEARLYVPTGTKSKYETARVWKDFSQIIEEEAVGINGIFMDENPSAPVYDLNGRRLKGVPTKGIYIQNGKKMVKNQ